MREKHCAIIDEIDREEYIGGGAATVSHFHPFGRALLPLATVVAMFLGGELAAQEDKLPVTPTSPECTIIGKEVTCSGNLSGGVDVDGGTDTYSKLYVNKLDGEITPNEGTTGIEFTSTSTEKITLDVNTGDYDITTSGNRAHGINVSGESTIDVDVVTGYIETSGSGAVGINVANKEAVGSGGNIDIDVNGDITTNGDYSNGISVDGKGGKVNVKVNGDITTNGASSKGVTVSGSGGKTTVEVNGNIETLSTTGSSGLYVSNDDSDIKITLTGDITVRSGDGLTGFTSNAGNIEIIVQGDITNWDSAGSGINTGSEAGDVAITLEGGTVTSSGRTGIWFSNLASNTVQNTLTVTAGRTVTIRGGLRDVEGQDDNETIKNFGTLTTPGIVDLAFVDPDDDEGTNIFNNMVDATYNSGTSIILGDDAEDLFSNAGNLSPGGANAVQTTELTGDFNSFITKTVDGEKIVNAGIFTVTIDRNDPALFDQFVVHGKITLNGGTVRVVGAYNGGRYTILKSTVQSIEDGDPDQNLITSQAIAKVDAIDTLFMDYEVEEGDNTFEMVLVSKIKNFSSFSFCDAGTANQRAGACNGLDGLLAANESNEIVQAVLQVDTKAQAQAAFVALSGEEHASLKGALMDTGQTRVAAVNHRMNARFGNFDAQASTTAFGSPSSQADGDSGFWITGYDGWSKTDATSSTARIDTDLGGVLFGVDHAVGDHLHLGVLGGYSQTDVTQRALLSSSSVGTWSAGLYGTAGADAWGISFGAIHNWHTMDTSRTVSFTNYSPQRLSADYSARSRQVFAEAGYKAHVGGLMLEPFAGVSHTNLDTSGFSETGGGAALTVSPDSDNTNFATLGIRGAMALSDTAHMRGMAGVRYAFGDIEPSSIATFSSNPVFTATGAPTAKYALVTEFGIGAQLSDNSFFGVTYKGRYGEGTDNHSFDASLRVTF